MISLMLGMVNQQHEFDADGTGSPRVWQQQLNGLRWHVQQPGIQQWWREWGTVTFGGEFRDLVDGLIRESEAAG